MNSEKFFHTPMVERGNVRDSNNDVQETRLNETPATPVHCCHRQHGGDIKRQFHVGSLQYKYARSKLPIRFERTPAQHLAELGFFGQLQHNTGAKLDMHPRPGLFTARNPVISQVFDSNQINNGPRSLQRVDCLVDRLGCRGV